MKKYLSIIALVFVSSVAMAQRNEKSTEASKAMPAGIIGQGASLLGGALPGGAVISKRISMNVTVGKQTQGATFGEKVNAGLHAAGSVVGQGSSAAQATSGNTSPLYDAQGLDVQNPLYKSEAKTARPVGPIKGVIVKGSKN